MVTAARVILSAAKDPFHDGDPHPIAVVDFPDARGAPQRLEFARPIATIAVDRLEDVRSALARVEAHARDGHFAVGFVSYDAAPAFDPALRVPAGGTVPLAWFAVFDAPGPAQPARNDRDDLSALRWRPHVERDAYDHAVAAVRRGIVAGDFYQVNHTLRLRSAFTGSARDSYDAMRAAQPRSYGMYLDLGRFQVASVSPELFFARTGRDITTRPMKGTAARGRSSAEDVAAARALMASEKDRAENVMIVDLVRNDLGRIAEVGSVTVPQLFAVERHPTVWQMTSTIEARLRDGVDLPAIFSALFPCGSVVGAPKIAAAEFIADHEGAPRGVYCGAMGIVHPGGDCTFNVAIRTLVVDRERGVAEYGAGGGITIDSTSDGEYDELLAKAAILRGPPPPFELLETLRLAGGRFVRREAHLRRLCASADYFDFVAPEQSANDALDRCAQLHPDGDHRVRLLVARDGSARAEASPMSPRGEPTTLRYAVATSPVSSADRFLFHKTTHRDVYDTRRRAYPNADEVILVNERGELTECSIGNLVVEIDGSRVTPPIECGLLPGIYREALVADGLVTEHVLYPADLARASRVWLVNSLREWVALVPGDAGG